MVAKQYADNKVDCYIYAVEKSLDSYKFNLLHNKQVFINQLKKRNLATRTIDEGAMDENGGVSFSEYVAILSGNDDLLEKAKLDRRFLKVKGRHTTVTKEMPKANWTKRHPKWKKTTPLSHV